MAKKTSVGRIKSLVEQIVDLKLAAAGISPKTNGGGDLGTADLRFANIFCQDLNLANERGNYTVIEEAEHLSIRNNKTGKLYKFVLEEVEGE